MRHFIRWAETKIRELVNYVYKCLYSKKDIDEMLALKQNILHAGENIHLEQRPDGSYDIWVDNPSIFRTVSSLPDEADAEENVIYLVPNPDESDPHNIFLEFIFHKDKPAGEEWELIGGTGGGSGGAVSSVNGKVGVVVLDKNDIGLDQVDNTSDLDKPISNLTQQVLSGIVNRINSMNNELVTRTYCRVDQAFPTPDAGDTNDIVLVTKDGSPYSQLMATYVWNGFEWVLFGEYYTLGLILSSFYPTLNEALNVQPNSYKLVDDIYKMMYDKANNDGSQYILDIKAKKLLRYDSTDPNYYIDTLELYEVDYPLIINGWDLGRLHIVGANFLGIGNEKLFDVTIKNLTSRINEFGVKGYIGKFYLDGADRWGSNLYFTLEGGLYYSDIIAHSELTIKNVATGNHSFILDFTSSPEISTVSNININFTNLRQDTYSSDKMVDHLRLGAKYNSGMEGDMSIGNLYINLEGFGAKKITFDCTNILSFNLSNFDASYLNEIFITGVSNTTQAMWDNIFTNLINSNLGANTTDVKTITFRFSNAVVSPTITAQLVALGYTISII